MTRRALALLACLALSTTVAHAQEDGPAAPPAGELPAGHPPMPAGHPPTGGTPQAAPPQGGGNPALPPGHPTGAAQPAQGGSGRIAQALRPPQLATASSSSEIPAGTIRVIVTDGNGSPVPNASVDVGVLAQGDRSRHNGETNADGIAEFSDLPVGGGQAYRVNVPHSGATYMSMPFNLPPNEGYEVRMTRLPVTHDRSMVFFHLFRVVIEQRGERLHVIHQAEMTNAGAETYAFPVEGLRVDIPEDQTNFRFQRVISDQRVEEGTDGEAAYYLRGSLPPGTVQLAWAYDLPIADREEIDIEVGVPMRFYGLQVIAEALPELEVDVDRMPDVQKVDQENQPCQDAAEQPGCVFITSMRRSPEQPGIDAITIHVSGIPGPGPTRKIAVGLALLMLLGGIYWAFRGPRDERAVERARKARRRDLLDEIRELEEDHESGEIGPQYRQTRRAAIVRELALLLHRDELAGTTPRRKATRRPPKRGRPRAR